MSKKQPNLAPFLDALAAKYHDSAYLGSDPLQIVHSFHTREDREIAALFCALLAYGNVKQILRSLQRLFGAMGNAPYLFVRNYNHEAAGVALRGFKHRFTDETDVMCLCWLLNQALQECGTLERFFLKGHDTSEPDVVGAAGRFIENLQKLSFEPHFGRDAMVTKSSFKHLLPRADKGSACKRIHLWLRWMIRPADGIDLGLWTGISPDKLIIPVDTHVLRIAQNLGLVKRNTGSLLVAREITAALRGADAGDPVRYDFALCRLGILKACPTASSLENCRPCELHAVCKKRASLERRARRSAVPVQA
ncbi:MAG: TIGR02757 family protein [Candidatus Sumerlaeaceae bacterium]